MVIAYHTRPNAENVCVDTKKTDNTYMYMYMYLEQGSRKSVDFLTSLIK